MREQEAGATTADACRRHGISRAAFYRKGEVGGPEASDAKRLYRSRRRADAAVPARLRELAAIRRRFGYRRLRREGLKMNQKKLRRLYREERLQVHRRGGRKRALARGRR